MSGELTEAEIDALAETLCRGESCEPCFGYDPDVRGGCSYCWKHVKHDLAPLITARIATAKAEALEEAAAYLGENESADEIAELLDRAATLRGERP